VLISAPLEEGVSGTSESHRTTVLECGALLASGDLHILGQNLGAVVSNQIPKASSEE
jgi:hypothetical protein